MNKNPVRFLQGFSLGTDTILPAAAGTKGFCVLAGLSSWLCHAYFNSAAINCSTVKFSNCFLWLHHHSFLKPVAAVCEFVHNNFCGSYFTILGKIASQVFVYNGEAQVLKHKCSCKKINFNKYLRKTQRKEDQLISNKILQKRPFTYKMLSYSN